MGRLIEHTLLSGSIHHCYQEIKSMAQCGHRNSSTEDAFTILKLASSHEFPSIFVTKHCDKQWQASL